MQPGDGHGNHTGIGSRPQGQLFEIGGTIEEGTSNGTRQERDKSSYTSWLCVNSLLCTMVCRGFATSAMKDMENRAHSAKGEGRENFQTEDLF